MPSPVPKPLPPAHLVPPASTDGPQQCGVFFSSLGCQAVSIADAMVLWLTSSGYCDGGVCPQPSSKGAGSARWRPRSPTAQQQRRIERDLQSSSGMPRFLQARRCPYLSFGGRCAVEALLIGDGPRSSGTVRSLPLTHVVPGLLRNSSGITR